MKSNVDHHIPAVNIGASAKRDLWLLLTAFLIVTFISIQLNLFERLHAWLGESDSCEFDEIVIIGSFFSLFIAAFAFRRWMELNRLPKSREASEVTIRKTNLQLSEKTEELEKQRKRSEKLSQLTNLLQVCISRDEAFQFIQEAASTLFEDCHGAIFVTRNSRNQLEIAASWGH